ncbi:MAG: alpha/beta hydrolase [Balneolaceae bacterium]
MKRVMNLLLVIGTGYVILLLVLFLIQKRMIYFPVDEVAGDPSAYSLPWENAVIETEDGLKIQGWHIPHEQSDKILLFSHGNAGNMSHRLELLDLLHREGLSVFIYDYRGYGNSEGRPGEKGIYKDIRAAWNYLTEVKGYAENDIILFGRSMGAAVSAYFAQHAAPAGLVIESGLTSVKAMASEIYPFIPAFLVRQEFATVDYLENVSVPVLIMHSREDSIIGFSHGEKLFRAAREPKYFAELRGGHSNSYIISGDLYFDALKAFISRLEKPDR